MAIMANLAPKWESIPRKTNGKSFQTGARFAIIAIAFQSQNVYTFKYTPQNND